MQSIVVAQLMKEYSNFSKLKAKKEDFLRWLNLLSLEKTMSLIASSIFSNATQKAVIKAGCN